jgi:hypothetical protein
MYNWAPHIVQSLVHGANVAVTHLQQEAILLSKTNVKKILQAGRPFVVTDPNPPIAYQDLYLAVHTLNIYPFRAQIVPPVLILGIAHLIEWYNLLPYWMPSIGHRRPQIGGNTRQLQPALFSICTHLIASNAEVGKSIAVGGLGYEGVITTLQGIVLEIIEWNREHEAKYSANGTRTAAVQNKVYTRSSLLPEQLRNVAHTM